MRTPKLGQHFLIHSWAARKLAYAAAPKEGEVVLEIGPGKGVLTKELLAIGRVIAIEKDPVLIEVLKKMFAEEIQLGKLMLVQGDIRDITIVAEPRKMTSDARHGESGARDVLEYTASAMLRLRNNADGAILRGGYVVAANIPYYITGEIIRQFLTADAQPRAMALLVQKEVAQRIVDEKESILSLSVKAYGTPRIVAKVGKSHFSPPPSVDSAILVIENISKKFFEDVSEEDFFAVVRAGFSSKRKMLTNNLAVRFQVSAVRHAFEKIGIALNIRAENVPVMQWKKLTQALTLTADS